MSSAPQRPDPRRPVPRRRAPTRAGHPAAVVLALAAAVLLAACAGAGVAELEERTAAAAADPDGGTAEVVRALTALDEPAWWRPGGADADALEDAATVLAADLERLVEVAASSLVGAPDTDGAADERELVDALARLLAEPATHEPLAAATAAWLDPRLPDTPGAALEVDDARRLAGWVRAVDAALDGHDTATAGHWYRSVSLASLDVADERARAVGADDRAWALATHVARDRVAARGADAPRWVSAEWALLLERYVVAPRWLDTDPDAVAAMAESDPPAWPDAPEAVDRWRAGGEVADDEGAAEVFEVVEQWLLEERQAGSELAGALRSATRHATTATPWRPETLGG